ncbi:hypothetical protein BVX95_00260 [archaeon D22]|nr:hypothetical protein BVX95_00260 [archaeon D22]
MHHEIEIKILDIDSVKIKEKLLKIGAKDLGEKFLREITFDYPTKSKQKIKTMLRLRTEGKKTFLTYKERNEVDEFLDVNEYETEVGDDNTILTIFEKIGLNKRNFREKTRHSFKLDNVNIEIDKYPTIPAYMELEGDRKTIEKTLSLLGYKISDGCNLVASQVLQKYGEDPSNQMFD